MQMGNLDSGWSEVVEPEYHEESGEKRIGRVNLSLNSDTASSIFVVFPSPGLLEVFGFSSGCGGRCARRAGLARLGVASLLNI